MIERLDTLAKTYLADCASFARVAAHLVETPNAYDVTEDAMERSFAALHTACTAPLTAESGFWRRAPLPGGRYAEVFNSVGGTTYAVRRADGTTEVCKTTPFESHALTDFALKVTMEISVAGRAR